MNILPKYDEDFCGWAEANALALQEKRFNDIDCQHLIEELKLMGASEKRAFISCLTQLLMHLLKWQFQPSYRVWEISGKSWTLTIKKQRRAIFEILIDNPSFKPKIAEFINTAFKNARSDARIETGLNNFPTECPYTWEQIINDDFYPE